MASNHTEHFSLNQWIPDDQVNRTDFNEDNAKIDAVLGSIHQALCRPQWLFTAVIESDTSMYDLDLSSIHWEDWSIIALTFDHLPYNSLDDKAEVSCRLNGVGPAHSSMGQGYFSHTSAYPFILAIFPLHAPERKVTGLCFGNPGGYCLGECNYSDLTFLRFQYHSNYQLQKGQEIAVFGIR